MEKPTDLRELGAQALVDNLIIQVQQEAEDRNFPADVILGHKDFPIAKELVRRLEFGEKLMQKVRWRDLSPGPDPRPNPDDFQSEEKT